MKSPFAPFDDAVLVKERTRTVFRGEEYEYCDYCYRDPQGREFVTADLGDRGLNELYDAYRKRHGIPDASQISALRQKCGLSASKMSLVLGFGTNQYRLYEKGALPNESNGKILALLVSSNAAMRFYIDHAKSCLTEKEYEKAVANLAGCSAG